MKDQVIQGNTGFASPSIFIGNRNHAVHPTDVVLFLVLLSQRQNNQIARNYQQHTVKHYVLLQPGETFNNDLLTQVLKVQSSILP